MRCRRALAGIGVVVLLGAGACGDDDPESEPIGTEEQVPGPVDEPAGDDTGATPGDQGTGGPQTDEAPAGGGY